MNYINEINYLIKNHHTIVRHTNGIRDKTEWKIFLHAWHFVGSVSLGLIFDFDDSRDFAHDMIRPNAVYQLALRERYRRSE